MRASILCAVLGLCACARPLPAPRTAASVALVEDPAWQTLSAQHRVTVTVDRGEGKRETRSLRGLIAVKRPDRLRLRALGPAGITLFDLLVKQGQPKVLSSIRGPESAAGRGLDEVIRSLAGDLACAYALEPSPPGRRFRLEGDAVLVEEPGRRVRLSDFAGTPPVWRKAEITAGRYSVAVEVGEVEVDAALDPALFDD